MEERPPHSNLTALIHFFMPIFSAITTYLQPNSWEFQENIKVTLPGLSILALVALFPSFSVQPINAQDQAISTALSSVSLAEINTQDNSTCAKSIVGLQQYLKSLP